VKENRQPRTFPSAYKVSLLPCAISNHKSNANHLYTYVLYTYVYNAKVHVTYLTHIQ